VRLTAIDRVAGKVTQRTLRGFGKGVTYYEVTGPPEFDEETGESVVPTRGYPAYGTFLKAHDGLIAGSIARVGETALMVAAREIGVEPTTKGILSIDGRNRKVVKVDPIYSGEIVAAWVIQAEG
jgi:hypothetical protein